MPGRSSAHEKLALLLSRDAARASEAMEEWTRAEQAGSVEDALVEAVTQLTGAFSFALITKDCLIAARDPHGFRPLALGQLGDGWAVTSETCALDLIGATYVREVEPGEVLIIGPHGLRSIKPFPAAPLSHCIFEHVYFARPDSDVFGQSVNEVRTNLGRELARETGVEADVVVPIPDSGVCAAIGFSEASGIPMRMGLIRNHYIGRTFIAPDQGARAQRRRCRRVRSGCLALCVFLL